MVSSSGITECNWLRNKADDQAEARMRHSVPVGSMPIGRAGIGSIKEREKHQLFKVEIWAEAEEECRTRTVARQAGSLA